MHLFGKQINRRITQENISHRTAFVNRTVPEDRWGKGGMDSLFIPSATARNIHTAETRDSLRKIQTKSKPTSQNPTATLSE